MTLRIDAHQHFWCYQPQQYGWISAEMKPLQRDFLPEELREHLQRDGMDGSVLVQARAEVAETLWMLKLAQENAFIKGVVGWVDLASSGLEQQLAQFAGHPLLCGLRHQIQDERDPAAWMAEARVTRNMRYIQQQGYVYDILITHRHLAEAASFAARHDNYALVLDHFGKPDIAAGAAEWARQIAPLAAQPHVYCKLSGLLTEPRPAGSPPSALLPFYQRALDAFGPERLIFGSDWPVCLLDGEADSGRQLCQQATSQLSQPQRAAIFGGNACRIYGLQEK